MTSRNRMLKFTLGALILTSLVLVRPSPTRALDQPAQNYFVEAFLKGAYHYQPDLDYLQYRVQDGLLTKGVSRIVADPRLCLVGGIGTIPQEVEDLLAEAVNTLTGGVYQAIFLPPSCASGIVGPDDCPLNPGGAQTYCDFVPTDQITVFIGCSLRQASRCYASGAIGEVHGGVITGGVLMTGDLSAGLTQGAIGTIRHEFGHNLGAVHIYGESATSIPKANCWKNGKAKTALSPTPMTSTETA